MYDSHEVMKKFEPRYRLVRYGAATKVEKASRQQRMWPFFPFVSLWGCGEWGWRNQEGGKVRGNISDEGIEVSLRD